MSTTRMSMFVTRFFVALNLFLCKLTFQDIFRDFFEEQPSILEVYNYRFQVTFTYSSETI